MQVRDENISPTIRIEIDGMAELKGLYQASKEGTYFKGRPQAGEKILVKENVKLIQTINNHLE